MQLQKAWKCVITILFSTILVEYSSFAQNGDEMYRQMRKHPSMSKEDHDRVRRETVDQDRINKLNEFGDEQKRQQAKDEKTAAMHMDDTENPSTDKASAPVERQKNTGGPEPKIPSSTRPASPSSPDSPKVSYDAAPDELQFPGDPPKATPRPTFKKK